MDESQIEIVVSKPPFADRDTWQAPQTGGGSPLLPAGVVPLFVAGILLMSNEAVGQTIPQIMQQVRTQAQNWAPKIHMVHALEDHDAMPFHFVIEAGEAGIDLREGRDSATPTGSSSGES
jgi:hypothetical protein